MYKISLLLLFVSSSLFPAATLLIRTGLQTGMCLRSPVSRIVLSAGVAQQRLQSTKSLPDHVPKLDAFNIFSPIAPMLWSAFYDKWGHAHRIPLSSEKKVELLKSVIALAQVDNRGEKQVQDPDVWQYRHFLDSWDRQYIIPAGADYESGGICVYDMDWTRGKFFDLALSMHLVMTCRNEPHSNKAAKAKKRISRIMKKYNIKEEAVTVAASVEKRSSRVEEGCQTEGDWQGFGWYV